MKNLFICGLFLVFFSYAFTQGNLQFNQTKIFTKTMGVTKKTRISSMPPANNVTIIDTSYLFWDSITVVVPTNKTLKIENISLGATSVLWNANGTGGIATLAYETPSKSSSNGRMQVFLFNNVIYEHNPYADNDSYHPFPLWLPSGTYNFVIFGYGTTNRNNYSPPSIDDTKMINRLKQTCFISAIEFNIVP